MAYAYLMMTGRKGNDMEYIDDRELITRTLAAYDSTVVKYLIHALASYMAKDSHSAEKDSARIALRYAAQYAGREVTR